MYKILGKYDIIIRAYTVTLNTHLKKKGVFTMKTLVVYYSQHETTKAVAEFVAKELQADIEEIKDEENRKGVIGFIKSGRQAMGGLSAKIGKINSKVEDYDLVIIGTPIWAGRTSSPVNAFLSDFGAKIKNYGVIMTHGSGTNDYASVTEIFASKIKKPAFAFVSMSTKTVKSNDFTAAKDFASKLRNFESNQ
jgi:flavodoxin